MARKPPTTGALDEDVIMEMIADGATQQTIADKYEVSRGRVRNWLAESETRSARAREAARQAAQSFAEKAVRELEGATDAFGLAKARELASHYRWAASKADSAKYGEKQQIEANLNIRTLAQEVGELNK